MPTKKENTKVATEATVKEAVKAKADNKTAKAKTSTKKVAAKETPAKEAVKAKADNKTAKAKTSTKKVAAKETPAKEAVEAKADNKTAKAKTSTKKVAAKETPAKEAVKAKADNKTAKTKTSTKKVAAKETKKAGSATSKKGAEKKADSEIKIIDTDLFEIRTVVEAMLDKKAKNVCSLDFKSIGTSICDYFIICNADSTTNVQAIADNVEEQMLEKCNRKVIRMQGKENAFWIILDYSNIVVHIFQTEYREFYRLEDLWADSVITKYGE